MNAPPKREVPQATVKARRNLAKAFISVLASYFSGLDEDEKTRLKRTIIDQYSDGLLTEGQAIDAIRENGLVNA